MKLRTPAPSKKPFPLPASSAPRRPVPVVRVFVFNEQGRLLLLKRANSAYGEGRWCLPGGKIDYLDTPEKAAARETKEETGIRLSGLEFLFYQSNLPMAPGLMHCLNFYFRASGRGTVRINEESAEFAWVKPKEAARYQLVFGGDKALKRLLKAVLRRQLKKLK